MYDEDVYREWREARDEQEHVAAHPMGCLCIDCYPGDE